MKSKKSPKADLENKRSVFFLLGLLVSLCLVLAAFEWESGPGNDQFSGLRSGQSLDEEIYFPPPSDYLKPPPPPMPKLDVFEIVDDKDPILDGLLVTDVEPVRDQPVPFYNLPAEEPVPETLPLGLVPEKPRFQGGDEKNFRIWILQNLIYPEIAVENNVSGTVLIQFTVNFKGYVQDVKVIRAADPALAEEAVRVISSSPRWEPGKQGIRKVNVMYTMPVKFLLR